MCSTRLRCLLAALAIGYSSVLTAADSVSLESLLHEMVARQSLARFPVPAYSCRQASSYDRDATSPEKQETWYANWDRSQFVRMEEVDGRKEYVMLDVVGPGAIVRIWATWHGPRGQPFSNGTIRFYLDGNATPAIEGPISEVLDKGFLTGPPLSQGVSPLTKYGQRGHNLYLPIPYAKHCKITYSTDVLVDRGAKEGEALYYQINYRTYEGGTAVESFSMDRLAAARPLVDRVNQQLAEGRRDDETGWQTIKAIGELPAGSATEPIWIDGPGAIRSMQCRLEADDLQQALRSTVLEITFDDERTVWCPIGDFCGTGHRISPHKTWYTHVDRNGLMACAWVMPFRESAGITLHNVGTQSVRIAEGEIKHSDWKWDERSMHFHATWRQLTEADTRGKKEMTGQNAFDVNYVTAHGEGLYVGDTLTIFNGAAAWWGEGDEKIYVDGEPFPSHFGTGTEDYYGYAWCKAEFFNAPFHAQPEGGGNMAGGFSVNSRYRGLDAIPFRRSIQFDMELWHWAGTKVNYAPASFWYARPGATCNISPDPETAAAPVAKKRSDIVPVLHVAGAIEGESLKVIERTGGNSVVQNASFGWSGDAQLWWMDGKVGDKLVIEFPVEKAGQYKVSANLTKANDYAVVQLRVNDGAAKEFDRFHPSVEQDLLELGTFDLQQGANRLTIEIVGINEEAVPRQMFGLDYLFVSATTSDPAEDGGWIALTDGASMDVWQGRNAGWTVAGDAKLESSNPRALAAVSGKGVLISSLEGEHVFRNLASEKLFADAEAHVEFFLPIGGNAGLKLQGLYEIQMKDSHGKKTPSADDCGGVYPRAELLPRYRTIDKGFPPRTNAAKPAGTWQTLDIIFQAPRFDADGKKTKNARFLKVTLNGQVIHEDVELKWPTGHAWRTKKEVPRGPLFLQGDHGPVAYRNVRVRPK